MEHAEEKGDCFCWKTDLSGYTVCRLKANLLRENYSEGGKEITEATLQPEMFVFPILVLLT